MGLDGTSGERTKDIIRLMDKVIKTGNPVEIERKGKRLLISLAKPPSRFECLEDHSDFIVGDPEDLVHVDWSSHWKPNL